METKLEDLPDPVLDHIVECLCLTEQCRLSGLSRRLRDFQVGWEGRQRSLTISPPQPAGATSNRSGSSRSRSCDRDARFLGPLHFPLHMYHTLSQQLQTLDLTWYATDVFWRTVADHQLFPRLKHVRMVGSHGLTDQGLTHLSRHVSSSSLTSSDRDNATAAAWNGIATIDITFCQKTSYAGTFVLRNAFRHSLRLLRRQPEWLDGCFYTPFHDRHNNNNDDDNSQNNEQGEIHSYYPDGTFRFNRSTQSKGYVMTLEAWNDEKTYLADKLQYTNFQPPPSWPPWSAISYRPGVCLLRLDDDDDDDGGTNTLAHRPKPRTVLVGQRLGGMRPPRILDLMRTNAAAIRVGESWHFNAQTGERLTERPPARLRVVMVSKMRVEPLPTLMPPDELVRECQRTCETIQEMGVDYMNQMEELVQRHEEQMHLMLA